MRSRTFYAELTIARIRHVGSNAFRMNWCAMLASPRSGEETYR
jgi:hypothetical protein